MCTARDRFRQGANKYILRNGLSSLLPKQIVDRNDRSVFTHLGQIGRVREQGPLRLLFADSRIEALGLLERGETVARFTNLDWKSGFFAISRLARLVSLEVWLRAELG